MKKHAHEAGLKKENSSVCQECRQAYSLRVCTTCGHVGCCDSSQGHARAHFEKTGHQVMKSVPQKGGFTWCYVCDAYLDEGSKE